MITLKQAASIYAIAKDNAEAGSDFIAGAKWMRMKILEIVNETSAKCIELQQTDVIDIKTLDVIDQFCDKIYEKLKEIEK